MQDFPRQSHSSAIGNVLKFLYNFFCFSINSLPVSIKIVHFLFCISWKRQFLDLFHIFPFEMCLFLQDKILFFQQRSEVVCVCVCVFTSGFILFLFLFQVSMLVFFSFFHFFPSTFSYFSFLSLFSWFGFSVIFSFFLPFEMCRCHLSIFSGRHSIALVVVVVRSNRQQACCSRTAICTLDWISWQWVGCLNV